MEHREAPTDSTPDASDASQAVTNASLRNTISTPSVLLTQAPTTTSDVGTANHHRPYALRSTPSVRIRRLPSVLFSASDEDGANNGSAREDTRRRSLSAPQRPQQSAESASNLQRQKTVAAPGLSSVVEERSNSSHVSPQQTLLRPPPRDVRGHSPSGGRLRSVSSLAASFRTAGSRRASDAGARSNVSQEYDEEVVDLLDVVGSSRHYPAVCDVLRC